MRLVAELRWLLLGLLVAAMPQTAMAQVPRVALVIGNSSYVNTPELPNPQNDATDMAAALRKLGFRVLTGIDLNKQAMDATVREFGSALAGAEQGVFFYAGHGLQVGGENFLVPVDATLGNAAALDAELVRIEAIQRIMEQTAKFSVLFFDACRDNPLASALASTMGARSTEVSRSFAPSTSGLGTLISFSTQPGNIALDGQGRNSPYTAALVKHIADPGSDLSGIVIDVRNEVVRATGAHQIPWEHSSLWSRFYFAPAAVAAAKPEQPATELALWSAVANSGDPETLRVYLERFPQGAYAGQAMMSIARADRWKDGGPARASRDDWLSSVPRAGEGNDRCRRLYALLAASTYEARMQCAPRRGADR
jgi:Caspase domain